MAELERRGPESVRQASATLQNKTGPKRAKALKVPERLKGDATEQDHSRPEAFIPFSDR